MHKLKIFSLLLLISLVLFSVPAKSEAFSFKDLLANIFSRQQTITASKLACSPTGITVISPNGGETLYTNSPHTFQWTSCNLATTGVKVELRLAQYDSPLSTVYQTIYSLGYTPNDGQETLTIPANIPVGSYYSYRFQVSYIAAPGTVGNYGDDSDGFITVSSSQMKSAATPATPAVPAAPALLPGQGSLMVCKDTVPDAKDTFYFSIWSGPTGSYYPQPKKFNLTDDGLMPYCSPYFSVKSGSYDIEETPNPSYGTPPSYICQYQSGSTAKGTGYKLSINVKSNDPVTCTFTNTKTTHTHLVDYERITQPFTVKKSYPTTKTVTESADVLVTCPNNKVVLGGGYFLNYSYPSVQITVNGPISNNTYRLFVSGTESTSGPSPIIEGGEVYATCARLENAIGSGEPHF